MMPLRRIYSRHISDMVVESRDLRLRWVARLELRKRSYEYVADVCDDLAGLTVDLETPLRVLYGPGPVTSLAGAR